MNMTFYFISWSEKKKFISLVAKPLMKYIFFYFTRWNKSHIHDKNLNILCLLNREKMCIKSEVEVMRPFCWHQNFGPNGLSAPVEAIYMYKIMKKMCIKSEGKDIFWNMQPVVKVIRPFCFHQNNCPQAFSPLALRQKWSSWNWYKMVGIIKALQCCQNLYQVVICPSLGLYTCLKLWKSAKSLSLSRTRWQVSITGQ